MIDNFVLLPSSLIKLIDPVLKYKSLNGYSSLPISYANAVVGRIPPDTVMRLFTKIPLLNDASPFIFNFPFKDKSFVIITLSLAVIIFSNVALLFAVSAELISNSPFINAFPFKDISLPTNKFAFKDISTFGSISIYPDMASDGIEFIGYCA